ncbi:MAG: shikimate dehydrogenase [Gammaproteobacteria bacterium]|nr:shikimate dehydrogenase [Gammaproteobacteria bacterium]
MGLLDFDAKPDGYGVMGNPISHSRSPQIHAQFAQQTNQRITYEAILVDLGGFENGVGNFQGNDGKGLNVTVPFKEDAFRLVDELSLRAKRAEAVNTIKINDDGSLLGENTDGVGLVRDLSNNLNFSLKGKNILVLGAGGAVRGVLAPLFEHQPSKITVANRTVSKAESLALSFGDLGEISASAFEHLSGAFDLIINGTAASLAGELPPLPDGLVTSATLCYDMMYAAKPTPFMEWGSAQGAECVSDGLGMLVEQAAESFKIWRGVEPETGPVIKQIRTELGGG